MQGNLIEEEACKQLWRPEGRQLSDVQKLVLIIVNCIPLNLLSCLPCGLQTGFYSFSKIPEPSPVKDFPALCCHGTWLVTFYFGLELRGLNSVILVIFG